MQLYRFKEVFINMDLVAKIVYQPAGTNDNPPERIYFRNAQDANIYVLDGDKDLIARTIAHFGLTCVDVSPEPFPADFADDELPF